MDKHYYIADSTHPRGFVEGREEEFAAVPYEGNMALVERLYYTQDGGVYKCTRNTINPVYAKLSELVGLYVEEATA